MLRQKGNIINRLGLSNSKLITSYVACKLNGYVGGFGSLKQFEEVRLLQIIILIWVNVLVGRTIEGSESDVYIKCIYLFMSLTYDGALIVCKEMV